MSFTETTLLAYADGELAAPLRAEVDAAIAVDADLARTVRELEASRLPYRAAFEQQTMPPVPAGLRARVEELGAVAEASHSAAATRTGGRSPRPAAVAAGRFAWLAVLVAGLALGYWAGARQRPEDIEPWVRRVADYHAMYARETVLDGGVGAAQVEALKTRLKVETGLDLRIPDLSGAGLRFVRAQQLRFDDKMVLQLVYLPAEGLPVAVCLTPASSQPERTIAIGGQEAITWHASGWAYLLIGQMTAPQLARVRGLLAAPLV
jgi:anti-sigma factor RsiW